MEEYAYWIHKIDQLWKEVEEIKRRVEKLEKIVEGLSSSAVPVSSSPSPAPSSPSPQPVQKPRVVYSDPVLKILSEKGPMNIIDLNAALREEGIGESVRDTLFKRIKKLMEEGKVGFDEKTQTFYIRTG